MGSWIGKAGGAILGGIIGGPVGAVVGAALGHGVDHGIGSSQSGLQQAPNPTSQQPVQPDMDFTCPHCSTGIRLPNPGSYSCPGCQGMVIYQACDGCGASLIVPADGVYNCSSCGRDVAFGEVNLGPFHGITFNCQNCTAPLSVPGPGHYHCSSCKQSFYAVICSQCNEPLVMASDTANCPDCSAEVNPFNGTEFNCVHCAESWTIPMPGYFTCAECDNPIFASLCQQCGAPLIAGTSVFDCPNCGANVVAASDPDDLPVSEELERVMHGLIGGVALAGKLAKIDGSVSREEIAVVTEAIQKMDLDPEDTKFLKNVFREAKESPHDFREVAQDLARLWAGNVGFVFDLMKFLLDIATADGVFDPSERAFIEEVRKIMAMSEEDYRDLLKEICPVALVEEHLTTLGLTATASWDDVRRAYRALVNKFHPDRISSKGLDPEFEDFAKERMGTINDAYSELKVSMGPS